MTNLALAILLLATPANLPVAARVAQIQERIRALDRMILREFPGPFELYPGMPIEELKGCCGPLAEPKPFFYVLSKVPKPHPLFTAYAVMVTPDQGLCAITATSETLNTDRFGEDLSATLDRIADQISSVYGWGLKVDELKKGALFDQPEDWTLSLLTGDRKAMYFWSRSVPSEMRPAVDAIVLKLISDGQTSGHLSLNYYFNNTEDCLAVQSKAEAEAF